MLINNGDPCVQRECAAETACCDHANLCALRVRCTKIVLRAHVLGHNFAPLAFQKPRLGFLTEQTALYIFTWAFVRLQTFAGREQDFMETTDIGVRVFIRRNAAAYCDEVSAPPEPVSYGFLGIDPPAPWQLARPEARGRACGGSVLRSRGGTHV